MMPASLSLPAAPRCSTPRSMILMRLSGDCPCCRSRQKLCGLMSLRASNGSGAVGMD
jgi:hypothetical protein